MARESKRRRDEKRFGRPERLADMMASGLVNPPRYVRADEMGGWFKYKHVLKDRIPSIPVISADNVAGYALSHTDAIEKWDAIPSVPPPFPEFFVEAAGAWPALSPVSQFGVWFCVSDVPTVAAFVGSTGVDRVKPGVYGGDLIGRSRWLIFAISVVRLTESRFPVFPVMKAVMFLGDSGEFLVPPLKTLCYADGVDTLRDEFLHGMACAMLNTCFLSVAFMHCKNVVTRAVEPDPALNRDRRKAGLKPFLRYHTINIEPMKKVLRTEGNIETNGLRKALHICRGHMATYTPERPLFGRSVGTFWIPAHVRGSLDEGVAVSDYKVGSPR